MDPLVLANQSILVAVVNLLFASVIIFSLVGLVECKLAITVVSKVGCKEAIVVHIESDPAIRTMAITRKVYA